MTRSPDYGIALHQHRFAAWAASRAASVRNQRFTVEQGRELLERSGFDQSLRSPAQLPAPRLFDRSHEKWRRAIVDAASRQGLGNWTDGVAAKLINVYLKSRFVCGGCHDHERVRGLHPPIDSVLLTTLSEENVGGLRAVWMRAAKARWSKLDSAHYQEVIDAIRAAVGGKPLWRIEEFWKGNQ